jgi:K+-transporting ATPase c subunit
MQQEEEETERQFQELKKKIPERLGDDREIADSIRQSEEIESSVEPAPSNGQNAEEAAKNRVRRLRKAKEMREAELEARVGMKVGSGASSEIQEAVPQNEKIDNEATEVSQKDDKELVVNNVQNGELRQAVEVEPAPKAREETPSVVEI